MKTDSNCICTVLVTHRRSCKFGVILHSIVTPTFFDAGCTAPLSCSFRSLGFVLSDMHTVIKRCARAAKGRGLDPYAPLQELQDSAR